MAIDTIERRTSRPSDDGRRVSGRDVSTCWQPAEYEASDSEHEQPAWQVPIGAGRRTEREASTSSSESESSDGGIDDDSLLERMAAAARRGARRMARRNAIGHRASRRVERHGGLPLATIQQRWDLAMTMPKARAEDDAVCGGDGGVDAGGTDDRRGRDPRRGGGGSAGRLRLALEDRLAVGLPFLAQPRHGALDVRQAVGGGVASSTAEHNSEMLQWCRISLGSLTSFCGC